MNANAPRYLFIAALLLLCVSTVAPASAHLSIIRQGAESTGLFEAGDRTGQELAAGDFNGDGYDDLAIGVPDEGVDGVVGAGAVIIMWGQYRGLDPSGTGILTASGRTGFVAGAEFGYAIVAEDFDADGYDDLAVGAPGAAPSAGLNDAGMVYFYKGGPGGFTNQGFHSQAQGGGSIEAGDRFGASLVSGNFDGDASGYMDLAVGSPGENNSSGAVVWFTGSASIPPGSPVGILQASDFGHTNDPGDAFGFSLAAGNVLAGGEDDLIIGAPFKTHGAYSRGGKVYVKAGGVGGPTGIQWLLSPATGGLPQADSFYGYALAIGKLMNTPNGHETLAVGQPWQDINGFQKSGRVLLYGGDTSGLSNSPAIRDQSDSGGTIQAWDQYGYDLAAGRFWDPTDGWDDLGVGSPGDGHGFSSFAGQVNILLGGPNGPGNHGWHGFNQGTLNESIEANDNLGQGLAFGRFDGTGNGHLIAGAPGEDNDAGMVHVIAPWRQTYGLSCRTSIVLDCLGLPVFSQKPYEKMFIASTTKILTVLIACERIQAGIIQPTDEYIVPTWVATQIGGSQVPLFTGEKVNFWDMLNLCLHLSGNDAAHALADWMHGSQGPNISVSAFVNEMNERAAQLGMTASHFNNPNGFEQEAVGPDKGEHYSTAFDMAILSREAMKNPLFADISDNLTYGMIRQFPVPNSPGNFFLTPMSFNTFFNGLMQNSIQPAVGIKGGWTPAANITGCYAAKSALGDIWVAGSYATPTNTPNSVFFTDAGKLLKIGGESSACGVFDLDVVFRPYRPAWDGISAALGDRNAGASEIAWGGNNDVAVEIGHRSGADAAARVTLSRISEHVISAGNEAIFGIGPFQGHEELTLTNFGTSDVELMVYLSYSAAPLMISLAPDESYILEAHDPGAILAEFEMMVMNNSPAGDQVQISVEESYPFDLVLAPGVEPFRALLKRVSGEYMHDGFYFDVEGRTDLSGKADLEASLYLSVLDPDDPIGTEVPAIEDTRGPGPILRLYPAYPNPFQANTLIQFDLQQNADVKVAIFDARGRQVRQLPRGELLPGRHRVNWDGRNADGQATAAGVYYYKVSAAGMQPVGGKLTIVR